MPEHPEFFGRKWFFSALLAGSALLSVPLGAAEQTPPLAPAQAQTANDRGRAIDISKAANRGFAHNGKNGWTDQGEDNDLRCFTAKEVMCQGIRFAITDPANNQGNSAVILTQAGKKGATLQLPGTATGALNLLHASAFTPDKNRAVGEIIVTYADGQKETIKVMSRKDCNDWWGPHHCDNARIAWEGSNASNEVGLYVSTFPLKQNNAVSATFHVGSSSDVIWMLVGATVTANRPMFPPLSAPQPYIIKEGEDFVPLEFIREVIPGSPLDFSWTQDAPAGKYGRVKIMPDGTFAFANAPQKRLRMHGVNLCFTANYLEKAEADKLVDRLLRCGYNAVRFHHHDTLLIDPKAPDSLTFNKKNLDRIDYLFAKCKEKGLYITTDLYTNRLLRKGDNIPECVEFDVRSVLKKYVAISPRALENWKEFTRRWMTHVNPYTGIAWGEDPALYVVNLINEDTLRKRWNQDPVTAKRYLDLFAKWMEKKGLSATGIPEKDLNNCKNRHFAEFLQEIQGAVFDEQIRFCREELHLPLFLTSLNWMDEVYDTLNRNKFDLVDNHSYWSHPTFPVQQWKMPFFHGQRSAIAANADVPRHMMPTRIAGKPFIVTEYNYTNPNRFRSEGGPLMGAYAALQNWDALYRFAWSHSDIGVIKPSGVYGFDAANSPLSQFSDRITAALFVRGDVKPAPSMYIYNVRPDTFAANEPMYYSRRFTLLGLITRIGSQVSANPQGDNVFANARAANSPTLVKNPQIAKLWGDVFSKRLAVSETGELRLDSGKQTFTVCTPRSATVSLHKGSASANGVLTVTGSKTPQTVAAIALDGKNLADSESVLIIHLSDEHNTGKRFANDDMNLLEDAGKMPLLLKKAKVAVSLRVSAPRKITMLKTDGSANGEVTGSFQNGVLSFTADNAGRPGGVLAYHLTPLNQ